MSNGFSRHVLRPGVLLAVSAAGLTSGQQTPGPQKPAPTTTIRDCPECPELLVVPAGQFLMGSPPLRGVNWSNSPAGVRSANRNGDPPSLRNMIVGCRIARTLP